MSETPAAWFAARTDGAPARLLAASEAWWTRSAGSDGATGERLARAGRDALEAAIAAGDSREAALDLLAADALITMALLAEGESDAMALRARAAAIRAAVTAA